MNSPSTSTPRNDTAAHRDTAAHQDTAAHRRVAVLASDRALHKAFSWIHLHEPQLRRWQTEFLPIEAPPFGEENRAAWFLRQFQDLGLAACHIDAEGNVMGELRGNQESSSQESSSHENSSQGNSSQESSAARPVVLVSAHLDTVFPPGTNCIPREEGALLHGPGACDNGAGLTALLGLAAALRHAALSLPCTLLFAANVGEEGEGDLRGMRYLFTRSAFAPRIRAVLALEGSGTGTVVDRALGGRRLRVSVTGPGGHSWADAGLPNPILALAAALLDIASIPLPESPRTTLNCGTLQGGTSVNSIPELAVAQLDLRSASSQELDRLEAAVLDRLARSLGPARKKSAGAEGDRPDLRADPRADPHADLRSDLRSDPRLDLRLDLRVERIGDRPAATLPPDSPLRSSLLAVDRHLRIATEFRIGSTDANLPLSLGVPALAIGAGGTGGGIHTLREWYDPTGRELALRRILLLLLDTASLVAGGEGKPQA